MPMLKIIIMTLTALLFASCASSPETELSKSAEEDYNRAQTYIENENYGQAILFLEKFSAKYPYSKYASAAEHMRIEAAFKDGQYILSETLGLRFINAHPDHKERIRVQFLVAMSYYKQSRDADLDQQFSHRAHDAFLALNQKFPNNAFTQETKKYLTILANRIAEHEFIVGKFYFDNERYVAAINRFILVKNDYLNSAFADQALYYLVAAYIALDQIPLAKETHAALKSKFPTSNWSKKATELL